MTEISDKALEQFAELQELIIGHSIAKVNGTCLTLDNGVELHFKDKDECCAWWEVEFKDITSSNNIITRIKLKSRENDDDCGLTRYSIVLLAKNRKIGEIEVEGSEGSGWYVDTYELEVIYPDEKEHDND